MPAQDESYISFVLAGTRRPPAWVSPTWLEAVPALDRLVALAGAPAAVRSIQSEGREYREQVRFGRLTWTPKSHDRWVQKARADGSSPDRTFFLTEIWAPGWGVCERGAAAPELFIAIENPHVLAGPAEGQFNQLVHVALRAAAARAHAATVSEAIRHLATVLASALTVYRVTPWSHRMDSVQDGLTNHFNYVGRDRDAVPDLTRLRTQWLPFGGELPTEWPNGAL